MRSVAARVALILQLVSHVSGEKNASDTHVDSTSMRRGVAIARWFRQEQRRVYGTLAMSKAERLLLKLVAIIREMGGTVSVRDWQRKRNAKAKGEAEAELQTIVDAGMGRWCYEQHPNGGRPSKTLSLNDNTPDEGAENDSDVRHSHRDYKSDFSSPASDESPVTGEACEESPSHPPTNDETPSDDACRTVVSS